MEVQLTDFENAAFTVFVVLLQRVILFFDLNLYIPMSLVCAATARVAPASAWVGCHGACRRSRTTLCARGRGTRF